MYLIKCCTWQTVFDKDDCEEQGLKMSGSGAARKLLPANPHRKFVTISQEIFRVKTPILKY